MPENNLIGIDALVRRAGAVGESLVDNRVAQELLAQVSTWSGRIARLQESALGALNLPSAVGLSRLERRVRGVSERIERLEDQLDRVSGQLARAGSAGDRAAIGELTVEISELRALISSQEAEVAATT
jgi:hypothetical protein